MPDDGQRRAVRLRVVVTDGRGRPAAVRGLAPWLARVSPIRKPAEVSIALVPDSRVRALNRRFRGVDRVTDVLSFPSDVDGQLGDIVIAKGVARRQARAAGHSPASSCAFWRSMASSICSDSIMSATGDRWRVPSGGFGTRADCRRA